MGCRRSARPSRSGSAGGDRTWRSGTLKQVAQKPYRHPLKVMRAMADADPKSLPRSEGDARPWERRGAVRRDCAPHRANWLLPLGSVALAFGCLSACLGVPALIGLPLNVGILLVSCRDLARMRHGTMDPGGRADTIAAMRRAVVGTLFSLVGLAVILSLAIAMVLAWR
jgi:hypothetical protein